MKNRELADQAARSEATRERARNVIVDAGAGTGKTTLLVRRLLQLIAPEDDCAALLLERIGAITFTRKAAGELKLRLREALLAEAAREGLSGLRTARLARALETLDGALIGTVHSFADRLLRLRPADARLSPDYALIEDTSALVEETCRWLLELADQGSLVEPPRELAPGTLLPDGRVRTRGEIDEAIDTLRIYQNAGLRVRSEELEWASQLGLDAFVRDVLDTRDRALEVPPAQPLDLHAVRRAADELARTVSDLSGSSIGTRALKRLARQAHAIAEGVEPGEVLRRGVEWARELSTLRRDYQRGREFAGDGEGWSAFRWVVKDTRPDGPLGPEVVAPLMRFMATRLVRMRALIVKRYAEIKRERGVLDQLDLLVELRDVLAENLAARAFYQGRFDHLLVDEFQDTDPLQAEILLYLCEDGARARKLDEVRVRAGSITLVGDPKQSIYRFRRADIAMYAEVCERLRRDPVCEVQLTVNFRSTSEVVAWVNEGFDALLGRAGEGPPYDPATGSVRNLRLSAARSTLPDSGAGVHVLRFGERELSADAARDLEGEALAHYLRYLAEDGSLRIVDPRTRAPRRPRYGDMAVVMVATQTVHHLTAELDRLGVPHVVRGGTLFMEDPLHQQFVLGLRALSDVRDGVARAALMRPPFFAVGLDELVRARSLDDKSPRLAAAEAQVEALRRGRHEGTPGEVARRVLEQTGFGHYVAASVNGGQRLARLYELCLTLDELARTSQLDFDGVSAEARTWIDTPIRIEAPLPIDADAVQVITAHQAKGLEWPIVALWDGRASVRAYLPQLALTVDAVSGAWALKLDGLAHDPSERDIAQRESALRVEERKRVAYVAATRARDLLIVPEAGEPKDSTLAGKLLLHTAEVVQRRIVPYVRGGEGWWQNASQVSTRPLAPSRDDLTRAWARALHGAATPALAPSSVTAEAHAQVARTGNAAPAGGVRFGPVFGATVHRALELLLSGRAGNPDGATRQAARELGLEEQGDTALVDVHRALDRLRAEGIAHDALRLEVPIAGTLDGTTLLSGTIDLLAVRDDALIVIDFKTDARQPDVCASYPEYVAQVRMYGELLARSGAAGSRVVRTALLFTADGSLHWV